MCNKNPKYPSSLILYLRERNKTYYLGCQSSWSSSTLAHVLSVFGFVKKKCHTCTSDWFFYLLEKKKEIFSMYKIFSCKYCGLIAIVCTPRSANLQGVRIFTGPTKELQIAVKTISKSDRCSSIPGFSCPVFWGIVLAQSPYPSIRLHNVLTISNKTV